MKRLLPLVFVILAACGGASNSVTAPSPTPSPSPAATPFQGQWIGTWTKQQLTQSGSTAQGTVTIGAYQVTASGPISGNQMTLSGQGRQSGVTVNVSGWNTSISGNLMVGSFGYVVAPDDIRLGAVTVSAGL